MSNECIGWTSRKWLLLDSMPLTAQGKIDRHILKALPDPDNQKLSQVQGACVTPCTCELTLRMPDDLIYFPDHFSAYPILPGVVQIAWQSISAACFLPLTSRF
jgi:hypothetical protein